MNMGEIQAKIAEALLGIVEAVLRDRREHYRTNPGAAPRPEQVPDLIASCANTNAVTSGAVSLIPGPWGMAAAVPEILFVLRNQLVLIYDVGTAHGHEKKMSPELILHVLGTGLGMGAIGLAAMHGGKLLVKRVSLRVLQQIVALLAGKVTQSLLKSVISKWLPGVGALAMAAWTRYTTFEVGETAAKIFAGEVEIADESEAEEQGSPTAKDEGDAATASLSAAELDRARIYAFMNLMKVDGEWHPSEVSFIEKVIGNSALDDGARAEATAWFPRTDVAPVDFDGVARDRDAALALLVDLVALARRDGQLHPAEAALVRSAGERMRFSAAAVTRVLQ